MPRASTHTHSRDQPPQGFTFEETHTRSANGYGHKHILAAHKLHYDPTIIELQRSAPLRIEGKRMALEMPINKISVELDACINRRESFRRFSQQCVLPARALATILKLGVGVTVERSGMSRRPAPNSGGLASVEVFPCILRVAGIDPGLYHYDAITHEIATIHEGEFTTWLKREVLYQPEFADSSCILFVTSNIARLSAKYGERGYRLAFLDAGHVSQNINLTATGLNVGVCCTAGFIDSKINAALRLDGLSVAVTLAIALGGSEPE